VLMVIPTFGKFASDSKYPFAKKINLGLDLQGGLYLVMGVDFNKVFREITDRQLTSLTDRAKEKSVMLSDAKLRTDGVPADDPRISVRFTPEQKAGLRALLE